MFSNVFPDGFSMVFGSKIKSCGCWSFRWWWRCMHNHVQVSWESCYGCPLEIIFMPADTTNTIRALATNQKSLKWKTLISSAYSVTQKNLGFSKTKSEKFKFSFCKQKLKNVWKLLKMSHLNFWILPFSTNFCPFKTDLSGNTVWPQALDFQKLAKMEHFWHFFHSKYKRSSLRSQCRLSQRIENSYKWYLFFAHFAKKVSKEKIMIASSKIIFLL